MSDHRAQVFFAIALFECLMVLCLIAIGVWGVITFRKERLQDDIERMTK